MSDAPDWIEDFTAELERRMAALGVIEGDYESAKAVIVAFGPRIEGDGSGDLEEGVLAKFKEALHPRDRSGRWRDTPGGAIEKATPRSRGGGRSTNAGVAGRDGTPVKGAEVAKKAESADERFARKRDELDRASTSQARKAVVARRAEQARPNDPTGFNRTNQHELLKYVKDAAGSPTTQDQFSKVVDGKRVYDRSRKQLHDEIIDTLLRERDADGNPDPNGEYFPSQDTPEVMFSGGGYAPLALDTPVPTPNGWSTIGQIEPGDYVFGEDGEPTRVVATSPVYMDRECFEIVFDDGSTIVADAEHKWLTSTYASRKARSRTRHPELVEAAGRASVMRSHGEPLLTIADRFGVSIPTVARWTDVRRDGQRANDVEVSTAEIRDGLIVSRPGHSDARNFAIENGAPLRLPQAILPIAPYTLGAWLGDDTTASSNLTCADPEIIDRITVDGYIVERCSYTSGGGCPVYVIRGLFRQLRLEGLLGSKRVPSAYLRASTEQRLELVRGLMDTDGTALKSGTCEFSTTSPALRDGMMELLASLGVKATCRDHAIAGWRIAFTTDLPVFTLPRKARRQKSRLGHRQGGAGRANRRFIVDVRAVPSVPVRCLTVESDEHLFRVGAGMVTTVNSGKGGVLKLLAKEGRIPQDAMTLDPDVIKAMLPEFAENLGTDPSANLLSYGEAWDISQALQLEAQKRKINVVVDGISNTSPDEMLGRVESFKKAGYGKAHAVYVSIPTEEAVSRAWDRARNAKSDSDRRFIPDVIMRAVHRDVSATVPGVIKGAKDAGLTLEVWDNNQGADENGNFRPPKPMFRQLDQDGDGVLDPDLWQAFLDKQHEKIGGVDD